MRFKIFALFLLFPAVISGQSVWDVVLKARALGEGGKSGQAVAILSESLSKDRTSMLYNARADAEIIEGKLSLAVDDYNAANAIDPSSGEYGLARAYALMGNPASALLHLEKNIASQYRKDEKDILLDASFGKIENTPEWRLFWKKERYTGSEKIISQIESYVAAGKTAQASGALAELTSDYPGTVGSEYGEALVHISVGRFQDAVNKLTALLQTDPTSISYLKALASGQIGSGNFAGAAMTYSKLIDLKLMDAELLYNRAVCYKKTGDIDNARIDIQRYLSIYPESSNALSLAGKIESASGNSLKAIAYFSGNLKLHPGDPKCYIDRADTYLLSKSWEWAEKDYSMSLDLDPSNSQAWLNKGISLIQTGKTDDACHDFRQALALGNKQAADFIGRYCIR